MKKFLLSAVAATVALSPIMASAAEAAPKRGTTVVKHKPNGRTIVTKKVTQVRYAPNQRKWAKGQRFDRRYAPNYRQIDYRQYRGRHLYAPPRGYQWVRSGNDAVLVAIASGLIGAVVAGALN